MDENQRLMEQYKTLFETWRFQVNSYWQRTSYFAAFETAAIAGDWYIITGSRNAGAGVLASFLGFFLTLVWLLNNYKTHRYVEYWWKTLGEIDARVNKEYAFVARYPRSKGKLRMRYSYVVQSVPTLFLAAWIYLIRETLDNPANQHWYAKPEWWLVLAALFTLVAVVWQAVQSRRAAQAAADSVEAMNRQTQATLLNAQAMVNAERPWLMVSARAYGHERFRFEARNHGKTPAEIVGYESGWKIGDVLAIYHEEPQYEPHRLDAPVVLLPDAPPFRCGACNVGDLISSQPKDTEMAVRDGGKMFAMYGKVLYYDMLNRREPPHESRFCFFWRGSTDPQEVEAGGSSRYVGHT